MDDEALVSGLLARREDAVRAFLERYRSLFHHCIGQFENDPTAREDLFQDLTWYSLERLNQGSYAPEKGSFGTWLYRVAWCRCVDRKRQENARRKLQLQQLDSRESARDHEDPHQGPGEEVGDAEVGRLVRAAMLTLDPEDRALLELRVVEGQILPDVAAKLSISIEQVKYRLKRAALNLRRALLESIPREEVVE
ncbi:MAG: sigma-70 family RNA polymerase sigma factor [Planctomycetota bacterium]